MRTKIVRRRIISWQSHKPGLIDQIMSEAENVRLPQSIYNIAADLASTIRANVRRPNPESEERDQSELTGAYLMRYAFLLQQQGKLVEAPPRKKNPPKKTTQQAENKPKIEKE